MKKSLLLYPLKNRYLSPILVRSLNDNYPKLKFSTGLTYLWTNNMNSNHTLVYCAMLQRVHRHLSHRSFRHKYALYSGIRIAESGIQEGLNKFVHTLYGYKTEYPCELITHVSHTWICFLAMDKPLSYEPVVHKQKEVNNESFPSPFLPPTVIHK